MSDKTEREAVMDSGSQRVRAWVLLKTSDPRQAAKAIGVHFTEGGEEWVIVRADVVEGEHNLIVPVDAANHAALEGALEILRGVATADPVVARVVEHYPAPVHNAHCFITVDEYEMNPLREYYPPGRHPQSPGANPWG